MPLLTLNFVVLMTQHVSHVSNYQTDFDFKIVHTRNTIEVRSA
jgi:hypothetical protein